MSGASAQQTQVSSGASRVQGKLWDLHFLALEAEPSLGITAAGSRGFLKRHQLGQC